MKVLAIHILIEFLGIKIIGSYLANQILPRRLSFDLHIDFQLAVG